MQKSQFASHIRSEQCFLREVQEGLEAYTKSLVPVGT